MSEERQGRSFAAKAGGRAGSLANQVRPPLLAPAHWRWEIVGYFFAGGLASGAALVAAICRLQDDRASRETAAVARWLALAGLLVSPILLIEDLGRPERFLHMLRIIKPRSPMSMGSWALAALGLVVGANVTGHVAAARLPRPDAPAVRRATAVLDIIGAGLAAFVGSYTGVLLAVTTIPIWSRAGRLLGPLFLTSGVSTALAAIGLVLAARRGTSPLALVRLHRADTLVLGVELVLLAVAERELGRQGWPLTRGRLGRRYRAGLLGLGLALPALLQADAWRTAAPHRLRGAIASALVLGGGLLLRALMLEAGRLSAADPAAYYRETAAGDGRTGGTAVGT